MVGNPAGPTTAPIGRLATFDSVAGTRVDALSDEVAVAPLEVPAVDVDGVVVEPLELLELALDAVVAAELGDDAVPVGAVAGGAAAASPELVPVPDASAFSLIARKSTLLRSATELSWTSIDAVSASSGTALPSTTRRP